MTTIDEVTLDLERFWKSGVFSALDVRLARLLERLTGEDRPFVLLAAALACQWPQRGNICVDIAALVPEDLTPPTDWLGLAEIPVMLPTPDRWRQMLLTSPIVGLPGDDKPLVFSGDRLLYLQRFWAEEALIARRIAVWGAMGMYPHDAGELKHRAERLFGKSGTTSNDEDRQMQAALEAAVYPFFVLTGGPGTGKTTTVLRLLALLLETATDLQVALAAPTGKAALRLQGAVLSGGAWLDCDESVRERLPKSAQTLHRLLGYQAHRDGFRHNAENPLPYDVVVVDEASMMDQAMAAHLIEALPAHARLILVGDRNQLPSVDAGAIFSDLCDEAVSVPRVELTRNFRFSESEGIGGLAKLIHDGDLAGLDVLLGVSPVEQLAIHELPSPGQIREEVVFRLLPQLEALRQVPEPEEAFRLLDAFRILCAHRTGPFGAETLNQHLRDWLTLHHGIDRQQRWYPGRPIMITENDYAAELFNGDTGIILPWRGKVKAFFKGRDGEFRHLPPARLPAHESAYAMTVHKSQGSEFGEVLLLLSDRPSPLLTRELLYTGVTRARKRVEIWSHRPALERCFTKRLHRTTGLSEQLVERLGREKT